MTPEEFCREHKARNEFLKAFETLSETDQEAVHKAKEAWDLYCATDSLYLAYSELMKNPALSSEGAVYQSYTNEDWCPFFKEIEPKLWVVLATKKPYIELEWGKHKGPIKVVIDRHNQKRSEFFEHSVDGMHKAFAFALELLGKV
jgi:hypothetical protein